MTSTQNEYIRNADITPICNDIRNAYMNELSEMSAVAFKKEDLKLGMQLKCGDESDEKYDNIW